MSFDITSHEFELKYDGTAISLQKFQEFAQSNKPLKILEVASWDTYYGSNNPSSEFEFIRFRQGPAPELTIKKKLDPKNNNKRVEIDVPLDPNRVTPETIESFCNQMGFTYSFKLYKVCFIYFYEKIDIVYYTTADAEMKERGRFVEVEARKDYPYETPEAAWEEVKAFEQKLSSLGITPQHRMRKSQWELNRKEK